MASYIPGGGGQVPPPIQGGGGGGAAQLAQVALAVKSFKVEEASKKRRDAQESLNLLMSNPQLFMMSDPKDIEKKLKEGYDIKITGDTPVNPDTAKELISKAGGTPTVPSPGGSKEPDPNTMASVANATQGNKSGAQSGSPASPGAANKAPGGGVEKTGMPQMAESLAGAAKMHLDQKYGALSPLYASAQGQLALNARKAQDEAEVMDLHEQVNRGGPGSLQAAGRLMILGNQHVTDSDLRNMIISSGGYVTTDPQRNEAAFAHAFDFALGNETDADKAKRMDTTLKTLAATPEVMGRLDNPLDVVKVANSIVNSGSLPDGVALKPLSIDELHKAAEYEKFLVESVGLPGGMANYLATSRALGLDISKAMPKGMQTIAQQDSASRKLISQADWIKANAEMERIKDTIKYRVSDKMMDELKLMVDADKGKKPWPEPVRQALIGKIAVDSGLMPEQVNDYFHFLTGGTHTEYTPNPDSELAKMAAGQGGAKKPKEKRGPTLAESGGVAGKLGIPVSEKFKSDIRVPGTGNKTADKFLLTGENAPINQLYDVLFGTKKEAQ